MQKITPHLWFDKEAKEAVALYISLLPDSKITHQSVVRGTPSGDCDLLSFELAGQPFMAISAGPYFKPNPSISFFITLDSQERIDEIWAKLADGGQELMPRGKYPFSDYFGWVQDKFGISWQLILNRPEGDWRPQIMPSLLFTQDKNGKAEDAIRFWTSVFRHSKPGQLVRRAQDDPMAKKGTLSFGDFMLEDTWIAAMDGGEAHAFSFNEAISLVIPCETQEEIDYYWEKLSADPAAEQCGWLKDKFGVSWQVSPLALGEMMASGTPEQVARVTQAFLAMKKFDIARLKEAFDAN